jgi:hypothetical protein
MIIIWILYVPGRGEYIKIINSQRVVCAWWLANETISPVRVGITRHIISSNKISRNSANFSPVDNPLRKFFNSWLRILAPIRKSCLFAAKGVFNLPAD